MSLGEDLLRGGPAIAAYLGKPFTERTVYHLAEKGSLPVFRLPNNTTLYARKSELDRHFSAEKLQSEKPEPEEPQPEDQAA